VRESCAWAPPETFGIVSRTDSIAPWSAWIGSVVEVDGHDVAALTRVFDSVPLEAGRPTCLIARTHKGRGVSFMEDQVGWHHRVPTDQELAAALEELGGGNP
jgi:transketolase